MKTSCVMLLLAIVYSLQLPVAAQLVPDGGTAFVNGVTNTLGGNLTVGTNGGNTTLIITNRGRVNNVDGIIGFNTTSSSNAVYVIGSGSVWSNSTALLVGRLSPGNLLAASDGGSLFAQGLTIGGSTAASNNTVAIVGPGSMVSVGGEVKVGAAAARNVLLISNAAGMSARYVVIGGSVAATNNSLHITQGGWLSVSNELGGWDFLLDSLRGKNQLLISDGGKLTNSSAVVGNRDTPYGTTATVSGPGSIWHNRFGLTLGHDPLTAGGHKLIISNSAEVRVEGGAFTVGSNGVANSALVTGPGSRLIISRQTDNAEPIIGAAGTSNELVVADGGLVDLQFTGRLLIGGSNSLMRVTGVGSLLQFPPGFGALTLGGLGGFSGAHARLIVDNGGRIVARNLSLNQQNEVVVSGAGSVLSLRDGFVGMNSIGHRLNISDSGLLLCSSISMNASVRLTVTDGSLVATNAAGDGRINILQGTNVFDGGSITVDQVLINGPNGSFEFQHGTLRTRSTAISNGRPFVVGDGVNAAVFELAGGTHSFSRGIVISANAVLRGCGTINGSVINHGTIIAECAGAALQFAGGVTNYGSILNSGGTLQFDGPVATVILGISKAGLLASVTSSTISGQNVLLEYKNPLNATSWTEILPALPATGHPMILNDSNASSSRFYRVRAQ